MGYRLIVISNWDITLRRVLRAVGIEDYFEFVFASLEEGVEKPEPGLFEIARAALGVSPAEVLHVGDDPVDDLGGAEAFGMRALLLDRTGRVPGSITSLLELPGRLASIA
jgi:putative hydrolase of the HAD superfamily